MGKKRYDARAARGRHITLESYRLRIHLRGPKFQNFPGGGTPPDPIEGTLSPASNSVPPFSSFLDPPLITTESQQCMSNTILTR